MKQIGKLFNQPLLVVVTVMLVVALAVPYSASAMLALETEDFNTCSEVPAGWTFENPRLTTPATATVEGAFSGDSYLKLTLGATYASLTTGNVLAPRLVTSISDTDFEIETKFLAPQINTGEGSMIAGMLFRDSTDAENVKWLRMDFNSTSNVINSYVAVLRSDTDGFIDNSKHDIDGVSALNGGPTTTGPILMRVKYVKASGDWTVTYTMNGETTTIAFNESDFTDFVTFEPNAMGLFVANGSTNQQAYEARVDYVHVIGTTLNDDAAKVTVNIVGNGNVTQTACPTGVAGDVVRLQAVANPGATFTGWSGDATGSTNPLDVTVNAPKTITATFTGGVDLNEKMYLPIIHK